MQGHNVCAWYLLRTRIYKWNTIWKFSIQVKFKNLLCTRRVCGVARTRRIRTYILCRGDERGWVFACGGCECRTRRERERASEYVCDVCGGHYEQPGVVARQRLKTHILTPTSTNPLRYPPPHDMLGPFSHAAPERESYISTHAHTHSYIYV